jgi:hypothetical protein
LSGKRFDPDPLDGFVARHAEALRLVYANPLFRLYRLDSAALR